MNFFDFTEKQYIINPNHTDTSLTYFQDDTTHMVLNPSDIILAITNCNTDIRQQYIDADRYPAALIKNVPLKNLSGAVGECFGQHLSLVTNTIQKNPHESGTPDFLPVVNKSVEWITTPTRDYYPYGGFDTKASYSKQLKFSEVSASSHHDKTSTVLVIQWAFQHQVPVIIGIYYTNSLIPSDWKKTVGKPGSKTTNAAVLTATGKDKLRKGWVVLHHTVKLSKNKLITDQYAHTPN